MANLDQTSSGLPDPEWSGSRGAQRSSEYAGGLPGVELLQGRSLSDFVESRGVPSAETEPERLSGAPPPSGYPAVDPELARPIGEEEVLPAGPAGWVGPGLRSPSGPVGRGGGGPPDFRQRATGFYQSWGRPPDSEFFRWDASRDLYIPALAQSTYQVTGSQRRWYEAVHRHHLELAQGGQYLQAYRSGGAGARGPWRYRWVSADPGAGLHEQAYAVVADGYGALGFVQTAADLAAERARDTRRRARGVLDLTR